jgi:hypothetical protein
LIVTQAVHDKIDIADGVRGRIGYARAFPDERFTIFQRCDSRR